MITFILTANLEHHKQGGDSWARMENTLRSEFMSALKVDIVFWTVGNTRTHTHTNTHTHPHTHTHTHTHTHKQHTTLLPLLSNNLSVTL
jgi:hypothetical protein